MLRTLFQILCYYLAELYYALFRCRPRKTIQNQHIVITGTAQGLGAQFARKLAKLGNIIHCVDIDEALNERMVSELTSAGHSAYAYKGDVTSWESLCSLKECIAKNGGDFVSYVINNAGIGEAGYLTEKSPKEIELTVKVNLLGPMLVTKLFLPDMISRNEGHMVNIASISSYFPMMVNCDYSATKGGAVMFTESLRLDLRSMNSDIKLTVVCPYIIATAMTAGMSEENLSLPVLDSGEVADEVIRGVRENKELMLLPRTKLNIGLFLRNVLPARVNDILGEGSRRIREKSARDFVKARGKRE